MNQQIIWKPINHPDILPGYLISPQGYIKAEGIDDKDAIIEPSYHSTNGYDFMLLNNKDMKLQLFPLDDIIAMAYIPIPESLQSKRIKVSHINGDTRDISLDNLEWVEDIEEWRVCTYPGVKPNMYEVSSWGRVRNIQTGTVLKNQHDKFKYEIIWLCSVPGKNVKGGQTFKVHRLTAYQFLKNDCQSPEVNHISGFKNINYIKNLEWVTSSTNQLHAFMTGLQEKRFGELSHITSLKNSDVEKICSTLVKFNGDISMVVKTLNNINMNHEIVKAIKYKQNWSFISDKYFTKDQFIKRIPDNVVECICELFIKYNGNFKIVLNKIHEMYPNIDIKYGFLRQIRCKAVRKSISDKYFTKDQFTSKS